MDEKLTQFVDALDKTTGRGRDETGSLKLADEYVTAHPEKFTNLLALSTFIPTDEIPACPDCGISDGEHVCAVVRLLSFFRNNRLDESMWECQVWLSHHFEPQQIGGPIRATARRPGV